MINFIAKFGEIKDLLTKGLIYIFFDVVNKVVPFFVLPILTYYIVPEEYGVLNNFVTIISISNVFLGFGSISIIPIKFYGNSKEYFSKFVKSILLLLIISTVISLFIFILFENLIVEYTKVPSLYIYLALLASLGQFLTTLNMTLWRLEMRPIQFGIYQVSQTVVETGMSLFFVISLLMSWKGRALGMIAAYVIFGFISLYLISNKGNLKSRIDIKILKECLFFGLPLIPHGLANWMKMGLDRLFISNLESLKSSGLYSISLQFGIILSVILVAFNNAFSPYLFKSLANINDQVKRRLVQLTYLYCLIIILISIVIYYAAQFIIHHFLDGQYSESGSYLPWILTANVFLGFYFMTVNYLFYKQKNITIAIITLSTTLLHSVVSFILIKMIGSYGAVVSMAFSNMLMFLLIWWQSQKCVPLPWFSFFKKTEPSTSTMKHD